MQLRTFIQTSVRDAGLIAALFSAILNPIAPLPVHAETAKNSTASSIKHVIIIIGENRTFDHVFATYVPKQGETVSNLLSKGIVNADGTPGPNYSLSAQYSPSDKINYSLHPGDKTLYNNLPPALPHFPTTPSFPPLPITNH